MQCYAGHYVDNTCFLISRRRASAVPAFFLRAFGSPISRLGLFSSLDPPRRVAPFRDAASRPNLPFLLVLYLSFSLSFSFLSSLSFFLFLFLSTSLRLSIFPLLSSSRFFSPLSLFLAQPPLSFSARSRDIAVYDGTMCPCFQAPRGLLSLTSSDEGDVLRCARSSLRFFFFSFYSSALLSGHPDFWLKLPFRRHSSCITLPLPLLLDRRVPLRNLCSPRQQHPGSTPCDHTTYDVVRLHTTGCDSFTDIFVACHAPFPYGRSYMGV